MITITPPNLTSVNNKERVKWLDVSRGLAFLMVIYSHLEFKDETIMRYFSPVFLTTFFFVSGYLFKSGKSFGKVFEQRTRTLLLPFLSLGLIMILLSQLLTFNEHVPFVDEVKGLLFQNGTNQLLWFVAALYVYSIIFYWIDHFSSTTGRLLAVSFILFFANRLLQPYLPNIPWHINSMGFACFYMGLGKVFRDKENVLSKWFDNRWVVVSSLIVYVLFISVFNIRVSFSGSRILIDALAITLTGIVVMVYVSKHLFQNSRLLLFVGANTLFYFAFHGKGYSLLQTVCHKVVPEDILTMVCFRNAAAFMIVMLDSLILILPAVFVNKYCPFLLGKGFKLWKTS